MLYTLKIRLYPSKEQTEQLLRTMARFNAACNAISQIAFKNKIFAKTMLQRLCYYQIRNEFKLPSQMVIRAIGKVCESYSNKNKRDKLHPFKPHGATVYDDRILTVKSIESTRAIRRALVQNVDMLIRKVEKTKSTLSVLLADTQ